MTGFSIARIISSVGHIGRLPLAPGTAGSFAAFCAWYIIFPKINTPYFIFLTLIMFFIGVYVSKLIEEHLAVHDPGEIVIDEWVGQWVALWWLELSFILGLIAFIISLLTVAISPPNFTILITPIVCEMNKLFLVSALTKI